MAHQSRDARTTPRGRLIPAKLLGFLVAVGLGVWAATFLYPDLEKQLRASQAGSLRTPVPGSPSPAPGIAPPLTLEPPGVDSFEADEPLLLVLTSASPGRNPTEGSAQIGTSAKSVQTYSAGALLPNGTRLTEIYSDHVTLEKGGLRVTLHVPGATAATVAKDGRTSNEDAAALQDLLRVGGSKSRGEEVRAGPLPAMATVLRSQPVYAGEVLRGIQLDPAQDAQHFAALGLEPGDLLVALDGEQIRDVASAQQRLLALDSGSPMVATIERAGHLAYASLDASRIQDDPNAVTTAAQPPVEQGSASIARAASTP